MAANRGGYVGWARLVAVTFNHRLVAAAPRFADGAADIADLVAWLRGHGRGLGLDGDRLCLVGFSGGGALFAAPLRERPPYLKCRVGFYPMLDVRGDPRRLDAPAALAELSPLVQLERDATGLPPLFLARAGRDDEAQILGPLDRFVQVALEKNVPLTLWNHPAGHHTFDVLDDERSRAIIAAALAFLESHLAPPSH